MDSSNSKPEHSSNTPEFVEIPRDLAEKIRKRLGKTGFRTISEYVIFLVAEVLENIEDDSIANENTNSYGVFTKKEQEDVENRLKDLGYL